MKNLPLNLVVINTISPVPVMDHSEVVTGASSNNNYCSAEATSGIDANGGTVTIDVDGVTTLTTVEGSGNVSIITESVKCY